MAFNWKHYFSIMRWLKICGVLLLLLLVVPVTVEHYLQSVDRNGRLTLLQCMGQPHSLENCPTRNAKSFFSYYKPFVECLPVLLVKLGYNLFSLTSKTLSTWTWPNLELAYFQDPWAKRTFWLRLDLHRRYTEVKPSLLLSLLRWLLRKTPMKASFFLRNANLEPQVFNHQS